MIKLRVGYRLAGTLEYTSEKTDVSIFSVEDDLANMAASTLIEGIEGSPADIELDAIEIACIEDITGEDPRIILEPVQEQFDNLFEEMLAENDKLTFQHYEDISKLDQITVELATYKRALELICETHIKVQEAICNNYKLCKGCLYYEGAITCVFEKYDEIPKLIAHILAQVKRSESSD